MHTGNPSRRFTVLTYAFRGDAPQLNTSRCRQLSSLGKKTLRHLELTLASAQGKRIFIRERPRTNRGRCDWQRLVLELNLRLTPASAGTQERPEKEDSPWHAAGSCRASTPPPSSLVNHSGPLLRYVYTAVQETPEYSLAI